MNLDSVIRTASEHLTTFGMKILGAIVVWLIGRWLIGMATRLLSAALDRQNVDPQGAVLAVRPYTQNKHYWQVYFDTNRAIIDTFKAATYPMPDALPPVAPA